MIAGLATSKYGDLQTRISTLCSDWEIHRGILGSELAREIEPDIQVLRNFTEKSPESNADIINSTVSQICSLYRRCIVGKCDSASATRLCACIPNTATQQVSRIEFEVLEKLGLITAPAGDTPLFSGLKGLAPEDRLAMVNALIADPTSPECQRLAICNSAEVVNAEGFLITIAALARLLQDPQQTVAAARAQVTKLTHSITPVKEFGRDVSFQAIKGLTDLTDPRIQMSLALSEHVAFVGYMKTLGTYGIVLSVHRDTSISAGRAAFLLATNQTEVRKILSSIMGPHGLECPTLPAMPMEELYSERSRHRFFGQFCKLPPKILDECVVSSSATLIIEHKKLHITVGSSRGTQWSIVVQLVGDIRDRSLTTLNDSCRKVTFCKLIYWENGRFTAHFPSPIKIPARNAPPELKVVTTDQHQPLEIVGLQSWTKMTEAKPTVGPCLLRIRDARFADAYITLSFDDFAALKAGAIPQTAHRMTRAFDPQLDKLGVPQDKDGANCITNFWDFSWPLSKPTEAQFKSLALAHTRDHQDLTDREWSILVTSLEGRQLNAIKSCERVRCMRTGTDSTKRRETPVFHVRPQSERFTHADEQVTLVGCSTIISFPHTSQRTFYAVESIFIGRATYLYATIAGAEAAAEHFADERNHRIDARHIGGFIHRVYHGPGLLERVDQALDRFLRNEQQPIEACLTKGDAALPAPPAV
jgi:hypothetical protein